ncbi:MAG: HAMP domain-containing sensor histidine kinase [Pseudomonadota bacterium]
MNISRNGQSRPIGVRAKLVRLFAIQAAIISVTIAAGIYFANELVYGVVMREAVNLEAEHFWERRSENPQHPLPDVDNLHGYMAVGDDDSGVPELLRSLPPLGFHDAMVGDKRTLVHVSERGGERLYLVFESDRVSDLAFFFGILPGALVLILLYVMGYITYSLSQRAISPIVRLADYLDSFDFDTTASPKLDFAWLESERDAEVVTMVEAVNHFSERLSAFIERERDFTRDAGHELRTPVAVFKGTLDLLEANEDRPAHEQRAIARMRRTVDDMETLLQTLLMLAREEEVSSPSVDVNVNDVVLHQLDQVTAIAQKANNKLAVHEHAQLAVRAPAAVVDIVLGNLIRNAVNYTSDGSVEVHIDRGRVRIEDSGVGMSSEELDKAFEPFYRADESRGITKGHGLGLSIVKRLANQFGWSISARSEPGAGTAIEVDFNTVN